TMRFEHRFQFSFLVLVRPEAELESPSHPLLPLLLCDVSLDRCSRNVPNATGEVTATPKSRQPGSQRGELLSKHPRCESLQTIHDLGYAECWVAFYKDMHVVRHDLEGVNRHVKLGRLLIKQSTQPLFDFTY